MSKKFKIGIEFVKNNVIVIVLTTILIVGIGLLALVQTQINSQKSQIASLHEIIKKNDNQIDKLNKKYASVSAALQGLLNAPTPTPKIQYINNAPSHPNLSSCTLEGNFYFCPADNCYYNPNGSPTGECKIPPLGGF